MPIFDPASLQRYVVQYTQPDDDSLQSRQTVQSAPTKIDLGLESPRPEGELSTPIKWLMRGAGTFDNVTTQMGLRAGGRETNFGLPNSPIANGIMQGLQNIGEQIIAKKLAKSHPVLGNLLGAGFAGAHIYGGAHNLNEITKNGSK